MVDNAKSIGPLALRLLLAVLSLLGCPTIGSAAGTWSVISPEGSAPGYVKNPGALAVDTAGNLYVADDPEPQYPSGRIQKRDAQGNWSVSAAAGTDLDQVRHPTALAVDTAGNLYVSEADEGVFGGQNRIQQRDAQGSWSMIATNGSAPGQVDWPTALAADASGNLFVADGNNGRIQERDANGNCYENRISGPVQAHGSPAAPLLSEATGR